MGKIHRIGPMTLPHSAISSPLSARPPGFFGTLEAIFNNTFRASDVHVGTSGVETDSCEIEGLLRLLGLVSQRLLSPDPTGICKHTQGRDGIG
jgi:hypothetical protein